MLNYQETYELEKKKFDEWCETRELKDFNKMVHLSHNDGSTFILYHSDYWRSEAVDEYENTLFIGVCTEHNGDFFFHNGDLELHQVFSMYQYGEAQWDRI